MESPAVATHGELNIQQSVVSVLAGRRIGKMSIRTREHEVCVLSPRIFSDRRCVVVKVWWIVRVSTIGIRNLLRRHRRFRSRRAWHDLTARRVLVVGPGPENVGGLNDT